MATQPTYLCTTRTLITFHFSSLFSLSTSCYSVYCFTHHAGFQIQILFFADFNQLIRFFSSHLHQTVLGGCLDLPKMAHSFWKSEDSAKADPSVKGVVRQLIIDLDDLSDEQPNNDVAPPPHIYIDLSSSEEDMEASKEQYKVLGSPSVASGASVRSKKLGFDNGCATIMCVRDKKVKVPSKSLYALGRSWFKEGITKKDKAHDVDRMISFPVGDKEKMKMNDEDSDTLAAKKLLQDFVMQAKDRARIAEKKGKKVLKKVPSTPTPTPNDNVENEVYLPSTPVNNVEKQVHFTPISASTSVPHRGNGIRKKRFVPKMRSLKDIMASTKRMPDMF